MNSALYPVLNQSWRSTTKILFGSEVGELSEFHDYLNELVLPYQTKKSMISGKDVITSIPFYPANAKFISQDETDIVGFEPLNINEIKDIDSLLEAVRERTVYCGNKIFGNCKAVEAVDNCTDCNYVSNSHDVYNVKYGAYTSYLRETEYAFGVSAFPKSKHVVRCLEGIGFNRCFECYYSRNLSDAYYAYNCVGCSECIFAFNLRSKHNVIGNLELSKDRYVELKKKLLSEMAEELRKNKRLFSIADISNYRTRGKAVEQTVPDAEVPQKVEETFGKTTHLLFGEAYTNIKRFGPWLSENVMKVKKIKGAFGTPTYKIDGLPIVRDISSDKLVTLQQALDSASKHIEIQDGEGLHLNDLFERASTLAYFTFEFVDGFNENVVDTPTVFTGTNLYKLWDGTQTKYAAYTTAPVHCSYIFGGFFWIIYSEFCINCYNSSNLKGCFEVDSSHTVNNSYFCHNCENVQDGIFCFNTKSKKYAVCNQEVGKEEYIRIKKMLLDYINRSLGENRSVGMNIFTIGAKKSLRGGRNDRSV